MTNQEATLKLMSECLYCDSDYTRCNIKDCKIKVAVEALEKQIPKKPNATKKGKINEYWCVNCNGYIDNTYDMRVSNRGDNCKWCGQTIDWSEDE